MTVYERGPATLPEQVRWDLGIRDEDTNLVLLEMMVGGAYELILASLVPKD
jgi:hypothetical protein